jgi:hypothetical protein
VRHGTGQEPVTLAHIQGQRCRDLLIYRASGWCNHSATMNADRLPDETPVRSLCPRMVCTACFAPLSEEPRSRHACCGVVRSGCCDASAPSGAVCRLSPAPPLPPKPTIACTS